MELKRVSFVIYHRLLGSLGVESSQCKLIRSGQLSDQAVRRLAFSPSTEVSREAWKAINNQPRIIYSGAERDEDGISRLLPEAALILSQSETEPRTAATVLHHLYSPDRSAGSIDYLVGLITEHGMNKRGRIICELAKIDPDKARMIISGLERLERK